MTHRRLDGRQTDVALDGECMRMTAPLEFKIDARALEVLVPPERA